MGSDIDNRLAALANRQHGAVSSAQLLALGMTRRQIQRRADSGRLQRLHRGVYAVGHTVLTREGRWMEAVLACGETARLSHVTAAVLWGLRPGGGRIVHVTVTTTGARTPPAAVRVHRSTTGGAPVVHPDTGLPVTGPERTLEDLAPYVTAAQLAHAVDQAEQLGLLRRGLRTRGVPGAAKLRAAVGDAVPVTRSDLERAFLTLLTTHGLPRPRANVPIGAYTVDFLFEAERLVVEVDGWFHGGRGAFRRDRARDRDLALLGYATVRFTEEDVTGDAAGVAGHLRRRLSA